MGSNLLSLARDLQRRKARRRRAATVIEGVRLIEEALDAEVSMRGALVLHSFGDNPREAELLKDLANRGVAIQEISPGELEGVTDTETPQGIVAIVEVERRAIDDIVPTEHAPVLVLDGVQDPGNVGALLRTAWALGCPGAVALEGTADITNPKVQRSAMGATLRFPIATATTGEFVAWLGRLQPTFWVTDTRGTPLTRLAVPDRLVIAVGNEGFGARPQLNSLAQERVAIPLARGVESLNVVVAAGIVLYRVTHA